MTQIDNAYRIPIWNHILTRLSNVAPASIASAFAARAAPLAPLTK